MPNTYTQDDYNPAHDINPNGRDIFAMNEHTQPMFSSDEELARFCGVKVEEVKRTGPKPWLPRAFAKWRYMCADAMIQARKG